MKKTILTTLLLTFALSAMAQSESAKSPFIEVRGNAQRYIEPDKIEISISLNEADSKGKITLATMEDQFSKALTQAGVDSKKNLMVVSQSSEAQKRQQIFQYKTYNVIVANAAEMNSLFAALEANSITNATLVRAWNSNQSQYNKELKIEAVKNAQTTAQELATALGQSIGKAIEITDQTYYQPQVMVFDNQLAKTANNYQGNVMIRGTGAADASDADFRKMLLQQSVNVRFELK